MFPLFLDSTFTNNTLGIQNLFKLLTPSITISLSYLSLNIQQTFSIFSKLSYKQINILLKIWCHCNENWLMLLLLKATSTFDYSSAKNNLLGLISQSKYFGDFLMNRHPLSIDWKTLFDFRINLVINLVKN